MCLSTHLILVALLNPSFLGMESILKRLKIGRYGNHDDDDDTVEEDGQGQLTD